MQGNAALPERLRQVVENGTFSAKSWVLKVLTQLNRRVSILELTQGRPEYLGDSTISVAALKLYKDGILKRYAARTATNRETFTYELAEGWVNKIPKDFPWEGSPAKSHRNHPTGVSRTRIDHGHNGAVPEVVPERTRNLTPKVTPESAAKRVVPEDIEYGFGAFIAVIIGEEAFRLKTSDARKLYEQLKVIFEP
jgi:hypothetical protein